jgi:PilZ domain
VRGPSSNRRTRERYLACFPASLQGPDGEKQPSLIRDLSETGVLLLVPSSRIAAGDAVNLQLYIADDGSHRPVAGKVVRIEELSPHETGPWRARVAVEFHAPITMYGDEIASFRKRAQKLGILD